MANIFFGAFTYPAGRVQTGDWNDAANWYISTGTYGCCCCAGTDGVPANRLPTLSDTVCIGAPITTPYSGGVWSAKVVVVYRSTLTLGSYSGVVELQDSNISGGTFTGSVTCVQSSHQISGGTFNCPITLQNGITYVSGGTFNQAISGGAGISISGGGFNTAIPSRLSQYIISGGAFDRDLILGDPLGNTAGNPQGVTLNAGLSTSRNISIDISKYVYNSFLNRNLGGSLTINGGVYTGLISIVKSIYLPSADNTPAVNIKAGSYSPPAVYTPAVKSGNYMTFASSAIPKDWGFAAAGGTFSPTIYLQGTSNDILGAGLL